MRLQKFLAERGVASRRRCEEMIAAGRVTVNGATARVGDSVSDDDLVLLDGASVDTPAKRVYIMLNKPVGVISAVSDPFGRKTVVDLVDCGERVYPVGRLDFDTSGLILLTNDGAFAYRLTHPKHHVEKRYVAVVDKKPDNISLSRLREGVVIDGRKTAPAHVALLKHNPPTITITIHEGRNRQVRHMCAAVGCTVVALERASIGDLHLGTLPNGAWRFITDDEVYSLCANRT